MRLKTIYIASTVLILAGVFFVALNYSTERLHKLLPHWTALACYLSLAVFALGFISEFKTLKGIFSSLSARIRSYLLALLTLGVILLTFVSPRVHRINFDEHIYQSIAQSIVYTGKATLPAEAEAEYDRLTIVQGSYNKQPNGFPAYLSIFFILMGISELTAYLANNFAYLICTINVFAITYLITRNEFKAIYSAAFFALTPMVLVWSNTSSSEISTITAASLAFSSALYFLKVQNFGSILMLIGASAFASYFRPESRLLFVPIFFLILAKEPGLLRRSEFYLLVLGITVLVFPEFLHMWSVRKNNWGNTGDKFSLEAFRNNFPINTLFYLTNERFPLVFTVFAFVGILFEKFTKERFSLFLWLAYSFGIFLFFYAGSYDYGVDVRFSLISAVPLSIFAGIGLHNFIERDFFLKHRSSLSPMLKLVLAASILQFLPVIRAVTEPGVDSRNDINYAVEFASLVPAQSMVFTHNPNIWLLIGKNAAQSYIANGDRAKLEWMFSRYPGGLYFHYNYWCNPEVPGQYAVCTSILSRFNVELLLEKSAHRHRYAIYRLISFK